MPKHITTLITLVEAPLVGIIVLSLLVSCDHVKSLGEIGVGTDSGDPDSSDTLTDSDSETESETATDTLSPIVPFQHLDATVVASVVTDDAKVVREWRDQSGNGRHALSYFGEVTYPSTDVLATGQSGLDFGATENRLLLLTAEESDDVFDFAGAAKGKSGFAFLIAFKINVMREDDKNDLIGNSTNHVDDSGFYLRCGETGMVDSYLGGLRLYNGSLASGDTAVFAYNYDAETGDVEFWTSKQGFVTGNMAAKDFSNVYPLNLGSFDSGFSPRFLDGIVGEVKIFDAVLSKEQFDTERLSMEEKWVGMDS